MPVKKGKTRISFSITDRMKANLDEFIETNIDQIHSRKDRQYSTVFKMAWSLLKVDVRHFSAQTRYNLIKYANQCCSGSVERAISELIENGDGND